MASPEQGDKPATSPLDAEREKLRKAGYNETEISQILVARALGSSGHSADAPAGQGVMSGTLSSVMAIGSYARGTVFTIRHDLATIFDRTALASARVGSAVMLVFKVAVISVLAFAGWQEWQQHIINETKITATNVDKVRAEFCTARVRAFLDSASRDTLLKGNVELAHECGQTYDAAVKGAINAAEIAAAQADKAKADACNARLQQLTQNMSVDDLRALSNNQRPSPAGARAFEQYNKDCNPQDDNDPIDPAREAQCDARSKAIVSDLDHLKAGDNEGVNRVMKQVRGFRDDCRITEERQQLLKAAASRAVALFQQGSTHPTTTEDPAACDQKFKTVLTAIETIDLKDEDPGTTLKTKIEQYKGECTVTEAQQAAAKAAFDTRTEKAKKIGAILMRVREIQQVEAAHKTANYAEALKLAEAHVAATEAEEIKNDSKAGKDTGSALANLSWEALFARDFNKAYDAATRSIKLIPSDSVPITNQAHALMLLGRTEEAKGIYLTHKGESLQGKTWEKVISEDFAKLREAGITHPMMAEIERTLSGQPAPTEPLSGPLAAASPLPDPDVEAVRQYKLAADRGDADAQLNLGRMYGTGRGGLAPDLREAARLYKLSADQGNAVAQLQLAYMYENGDVLPKDWPEAARLYRLAADQGNPEAQANLADFYERGDAGLRRNACEAMRLRKLAAAQGNAYAAKNLKEASATRCKP